MTKKIVIIGAGIAGLSAGCYARMNGYDAEIYEMHSLPGGMCTAWKRKGYTIDGCISWLTGSSPKNNFYKIWEELGAVQGRHMIDHEAFERFINADGRVFIVYCDADKLEKHMKELSPQDAETIEVMCRYIRRFTKFRMPVTKAFQLFTRFDILKMMLRMMPYAKDYKFCNQISIDEFAQRFKDPFLREVIPMMFYDKEISFFILVSTLALLQNKAGGFPEGGSLAFAQAIEKRFLDLKGTIHYNQKVMQILEENGRAVGIRLADGKDVTADYVISAADLKTTIYHMLDGKHLDPVHESLFQNYKVFPSCVQISFGVKKEFPAEGGGASFIIHHLHKSLKIGTQTIEWFFEKNYSFDPTFAPRGKTVVECMIWIHDFFYWEELHADKQAYQEQKKQLEALMADEMERIYPGFKEAIEMTDVATPMTYVRYTGSWKGTFMTWVPTPKTTQLNRMIKKTVPGLENFWLSGMWVVPPGGVPGGAKSSRDIIQIICKKDNKRFRTEVPKETN
jgi:phytoene dehydrogenase-like protein